MTDSAGETPATPNEEIMRATYRALRKEGYTNLTIKQIAEEYGKSTAAVHYYYETKDDLLVAFLNYLIELYVDEINQIETTDPRERLELLLDELLCKPKDHLHLLGALLAMRSQTPHNQAFRERFKQNDEYIQYTLKAAINHGIDEGVFEERDPSHTTHALMSIIDGGRTRAVVLDDPDELDVARETAAEYVDSIVAKERV
ncbi:transcription regulator [Haloferax mucosum ATCC BAA-1512]|uniref:Transcription regulator n=1 Tax=Haloferax mucosum ATCC BAA-1512 TaxID=662479 RepID=M0IJ92_9EURY|nr:TetR family transcriptional regulator C-terminal domain-containing protein [Haloferax mucosum]ELZ95933.1 transcription regulator [Haloferax mucosum ATCC BAA-1512]